MSTNAVASNSLAAACLGVGLATAWGPSALGDVQTAVWANSRTNGAISHATVISGGLGSGAAGGGGGIVYRGLSVPAGQSGLSNLTILYRSEVATPAFGNSWAMVGISEGSGSMHLVVSAPGLTYLGMAFEQAFPGFNEAQLIDSLLAGGSAGETFLRTNFALLLQGHGQEAHCISFSNGTDFGTLTIGVNQVPTPASAVLMAFAGLAARRRRRA